MTRGATHMEMTKHVPTHRVAGRFNEKAFVVKNPELPVRGGGTTKGLTRKRFLCLRPQRQHASNTFSVRVPEEWLDQLKQLLSLTPFRWANPSFLTSRQGK